MNGTSNNITHHLSTECARASRSWLQQSSLFQKCDWQISLGEVWKCDRHKKRRSHINIFIESLSLSHDFLSAKKCGRTRWARAQTLNKQNWPWAAWKFSSHSGARTLSTGRVIILAKPGIQFPTYIVISSHAYFLNFSTKPWTSPPNICCLMRLVRVMFHFSKDYQSNSKKICLVCQLQLRQNSPLWWAQKNPKTNGFTWSHKRRPVTVEA